MPYVYVVAKSAKCDECLLPDLDNLHYTQAGTIYKCDYCGLYYQMRLMRRGRMAWLPIDEEEVDKILLPKNKKKRKDKNSYTGDAYCVGCKDKVEFEGTIKTSDSGRRMAQGVCNKCGSKLNRILGKA
jgi:NAD-dependent SIR2 family protein deacetylase